MHDIAVLQYESKIAFGPQSDVIERYFFLFVYFFSTGNKSKYS